VQAILDGHDRFRGAELVDAIFAQDRLERRCSRSKSDRSFGDPGDWFGPRYRGGREGKVEETFGQLVSEWLGDEPSVSVSKGSKDKQARLGRSKNVLDLEQQDVSSLRYQLLHRTASAVYEAERYRASTALMLVDSFSAQQSGWTGFARFVRAIGISENPQPGLILGPKRCAEVELYVGWL